MHHSFIFRLLVCLLILNLDACGDVATLPEQAGIGPHPTLPPPNPTLLPTVNIAPAKGWSADLTPRPAAGLAVIAFATGLDHPRWLYVLHNRAAIWEVEPATGRSRIFASGLRNPNGLAWQPQSGTLWTTVNERDEIGSDLVPDYMTSVKDGAFYGWPYSYYGQHADTRVKPPRPDQVAKAIAPDYALGAHTASLGLVFYTGNLLPKRFMGGAFIGQHGSWNRQPRSGYKVIFVPFADGHPAGSPEDILTGFVSAQGDALGRPVGVAVDRAGALLVADDVGNSVWRVTPDRVK
jgi:glucose/arabinose dehydrogenase